VAEVTSAAKAAMVRPIVARVLGENGVSEAVIQEVIDGIDEVIARPPPALGDSKGEEGDSEMEGEE
jgi:hypothetical protein